MPEYDFSLTRVFPSKDTIEYSILIWENTDHRKLVLFHYTILCSAKSPNYKRMKILRNQDFQKSRKQPKDKICTHCPLPAPGLTLKIINWLFYLFLKVTKVLSCLYPNLNHKP